MHDKQQLRQTVKQLKRALTPAEREELSQRICATIESLPGFDRVKHLMLYHALPDEVDTRPLLSKWSTAKQLYLPIVDGDDLVVAAYVWKVLAHGGWRPELSGCCACGDADVAYFSAAAGGALCASCAHEVAGAQEVGPGQLSWLRALLGSTFDELLAAPADAETALFLLGVAHVWAATHLDARLRAMEFYLGA